MRCAARYSEPKPTDGALLFSVMATCLLGCGDAPVSAPEFQPTPTASPSSSAPSPAPKTTPVVVDAGAASPRTARARTRCDGSVVAVLVDGEKVSTFVSLPAAFTAVVSGSVQGAR